MYPSFELAPLNSSRRGRDIWVEKYYVIPSKARATIIRLPPSLIIGSSTTAAPLRLILMSQRFKRPDDAGNQFNPEQPEDGSLNATADNAEGMEEVEEQEGYSAYRLLPPFVAQSEQLTRYLVL